MAKLTTKEVDAQIRRAKAGEAVKEYWPDGAGLYLRILKSGAASFWLRQSGYAPYKLCDADLGLAKARELSLLARAARAGGVDPAIQRKAARQQAKADKAAAAVRAVAPDNVAAVYDDYERRHLRPKMRSAHNANLAMRREIIPLWGELPIGSITRHMVAKVVHDVADRGTPRAAVVLLSYVSGFFKWSVGMGYIDDNPAARVPHPKVNEPRERVLRDDELRLIWQACDRMDAVNAPFIRLLMITGQRKAEIGAGLWSEIDAAERKWALPKSRVKNKTDHTFPLSGMAMDILSGLQRRDSEDRIFAGRKGGVSWGGSHVKDRFDEEVAELNGSPIPHWTWHDLRRTCATGMGNLGVQPHIIECCLNHIGGFRAGVAGTYNRSSYWPEMVDAFDRWDAHLRVVVSGAGNVLTLRRA
jgi:integrase